MKLLSKIGAVAAIALFASPLVAVAFFASPTVALASNCDDDCNNNNNSTTANVPVTGSVSDNCSTNIVSSSLAFPAYNVYNTTDTTANATVSFNCTLGVNPTVYISNESNGGAHGTGSEYALKNGTSNWLGYSVYSNSGLTTLFPTTNGGAIAPQASTPQAPGTQWTATLYGKIPHGQSAVFGSYTDSLTVTINY